MTNNTPQTIANSINNDRTSVLGLGTLVVSALIAISTFGYNMAVTTQADLASVAQTDSIANQAKPHQPNARITEPIITESLAIESFTEKSKPAQTEPVQSQPRPSITVTAASPNVLPQEPPSLLKSNAEAPPVEAPQLANEIAGVSPADPDVIVLQIEPSTVLESLNAELARVQAANATENGPPPAASAQSAPSSDELLAAETSRVEAPSVEVSNAEAATIEVQSQSVPATDPVVNIIPDVVPQAPTPNQDTQSSNGPAAPSADAEVSEQVTASSLIQPDAVQNPPAELQPQRRDQGQPNITIAEDRRRGSNRDGRPRRNGDSRRGQGQPPRPRR